MPRKYLIIMLVASAFPAAAQKPKQPWTIKTTFTIDAPGTKLWRRSGADPIALAQKVDAAMRRLKGSRQLVRVQIDGPRGKVEPRGGRGESIEEVKIQDSTHFAIKYPNFDAPVVYGGQVRANGTFFVILGPAGWSKPTPLPKTPINTITGAQALRAWPLAFPRMIYTNLVLRSSIWTTVAAALKNGTEGFQAIVEERLKKAPDGTMVRSYRILARRGAASVRKLGRATLEMVFDARMYLPVTIRVDMQGPKAKKKTRVVWQSIWSFGNKFQQREFKIPGLP